jgi:hypothetical protein
MPDPRDGPDRDDIPANPYPPPADSPLSDEAQLGKPPPPPPMPPSILETPWENGEPVFVLRASDRLAGILVRGWARMSDALGLRSTAEVSAAFSLAERMDAWRHKHIGKP